jgi:Amino acid transporters
VRSDGYKHRRARRPTNIGTLFAFILVCLGVNVLRRVNPERPRPFRVPFVPVFPILGVFMCLALMLSLPVMTWIRFVVWLGIGLVIYFLYSVRHSKLQRGVDVGDGRHSSADHQNVIVRFYRHSSHVRHCFATILIGMTDESVIENQQFPRTN